MGTAGGIAWPGARSAWPRPWSPMRFWVSHPTPGTRWPGSVRPWSWSSDDPGPTAGCVVWATCWPGAGIGALTGHLVGGRGRLAGLVAATYVAVAGRALCEGADRVDRALRVGDLGEARRLVGHLVGTGDGGDEQAEVVRAAVESSHETPMDGGCGGPAHRGVLGRDGCPRLPGDQPALDAMVRTPLAARRLGWAWPAGGADLAGARVAGRPGHGRPRWRRGARAAAARPS